MSLTVEGGRRLPRTKPGALKTSCCRRRPLSVTLVFRFHDTRRAYVPPIGGPINIVVQPLFPCKPYGQNVQSRPNPSQKTPQLFGSGRQKAKAFLGGADECPLFFLPRASKNLSAFCRLLFCARSHLIFLFLVLFCFLFGLFFFFFAFFVCDLQHICIKTKAFAYCFLHLWNVLRSRPSPPFLWACARGTLRELILVGPRSRQWLLREWQESGWRVVVKAPAAPVAVWMGGHHPVPSLTIPMQGCRRRMRPWMWQRPTALTRRPGFALKRG